MYRSYSPAYDPAYTPVVPRRKKRSKSVPSRYSAPASSINTTISSNYSSVKTSTETSYQQRAYNSIRARYLVPQTTPPRKSISNVGNNIPPPSYQTSLMRVGESTGLRADPYYYASRDYLSRTGSYYGTYSRPKRQRKPTNTRYSQFYPDSYGDVYSPGYGHGYHYASNPTRRQRVAVGQRPVIVETYDDLGRANHYLV